MPRYAWNRSDPEIKARYFELIRQGWEWVEGLGGRRVSLSCGSLWFIDAGSVSFIETKISSRFLSQDDRIEIADGLARKEPVKDIATRIGRSPSTVYREIERNRKPDGSYQPWFAHNQAHLRRRRPKEHRFVADAELRTVVAEKLAVKWSPAQISRWLRRRWPRRLAWHVCHETIYEAVLDRGLIVVANAQTLRPGRTYRRRRGRGRSRDGSLKQSTNLKPIHARPKAAESRRQVGHWEGDLFIGAGLQSRDRHPGREQDTLHGARPPARRTHRASRRGPVDRNARSAPVTASTLAHLGPRQRDVPHERIETETGVSIYFADPHSPWQRRHQREHQWPAAPVFPKGSDLSRHGPERLAAVAAELNDRPAPASTTGRQHSSCEDGCHTL